MHERLDGLGGHERLVAAPEVRAKSSSCGRLPAVCIDVLVRAFRRVTLRPPVCVCEREKVRERRERVCVCACIDVLVRAFGRATLRPPKRERERERERERTRERERERDCACLCARVQMC